MDETRPILPLGKNSSGEIQRYDGDRSPAVSAAVASQAGRRTWASWAGRSSPSNFGTYRPGDELRGLWRMTNRTVFGTSTTKSSECPVCFCEVEADNNISLWCGCNVCEDCMRGWVAAQLEDAGASAFILKCPVCQAVVRPEDAQRVMSLDKKLYRQHSSDVLAKSLRTDPDFVSCPKCQGGGFMDGACMEQREQSRATAMNNQLKCVSCIAIVLFVVFVALAIVFRQENFVWGWLLLAALSIVLQGIVYIFMRRVLAKLREVQCPECEAVFLLGGQKDKDQEAETEAWIRNNTRECPRCKVPISKNGGCNHMKCQSCKADFCWACMKLGSKCGPYGCHNGAPYGNASVIGEPRPFLRYQTCLTYILVYLGLLALCLAGLEVLLKHSVILLFAKVLTWGAIVALCLCGCCCCCGACVFLMCVAAVWAERRDYGQEIGQAIVNSCTQS